MTYADNFDLRDKDLYTINDVADAIDGLTAVFATDYYSSKISTTSSSFAATGLSQAITVPANAVVYIIASMQVTTATTEKLLDVQISEDAGSITSRQVEMEWVDADGKGPTITWFITSEPAAGSRTYSVEWASNDNSTQMNSRYGAMLVFIQRQDA